MAKRKNYSADEKVRLLREHLVDKVAVSEICDRIGLNPNVFYRWQKQFFENGAAAFSGQDKGQDKDRKARMDKRLERQNARLRAKITQKDEVIAEIMESHVQLKKSLGED